MTAQTVAVASPAATTARRARPFLGFGTVFRKEIEEWVRGRRALIVGFVSVLYAVPSALAPFFVPKTPGMPLMSTEPTHNVLLGWNGITIAFIVVLATMTLLSSERDRGTLGWTLTNPVSPSSIIAAKWSAAMVVYGLVGVFLPLASATITATIAYGEVPALGSIALFSALYLMVPAFFIGLTIATATAVRSVPGIAAIGFLVLLVPGALVEFLPIVGEVAPGGIGMWAMATATGQPASTLTLAGWLVGMAILIAGAKVVFDRQEH